MKKFFCIVVLAIIAFLCIPFAVSAKESEDDLKGIIDALTAVETDENIIKSSGIDLHDLNYSDTHIYAYDYTGEGFIYNSEFIPLSIDEKLVGWIIKKIEENEVIYQFTTAFVEQVENIICTETNLAIIYDYNASYIFDGKELYKIRECSILVESRAVINYNDEIDYAEIKLNPILCESELQYNSQYAYASAPIYYACNVSFVSQNPPSNMCWAASAACIINYLSNTNYSAINIARSWYAADNYNTGLPHGDEEDLLLNYYITYTYRAQVPADGIIFYNIYNDYPIFATFYWTKNSSSGYHAVVIYGINITGGYIYVMDPEYGLCASSYSASVGYTYVSAYSGATMVLNQATCKYWRAS